MSSSYAETSAVAPLRSLVVCYWASAGGAKAKRVLPDGCIDILVDESGAVVVGTMTRAIVAESRRPVIGIRFQPGEAARLLPEAPRYLTDDVAPLEAMWGAEGRRFGDRVASMLGSLSSPEAILDKLAAPLDDLLRARLASHGVAGDMRVREAARLLSMGHSVRETATRTDLSERQLGRRFEARVGVGPKTFARVMRLSRAASALANHVPASIAALEAGYADQAHFSRDAAALAGVTPRALAAELVA